MRRLTVLLTASALMTGVALPATAASKPYLGGPCKKIHQVDWVKGVRAQCTWVPVKSKKRGKLIWKALAPAKTTATRAELGLPPDPTPSPTPSPSVTPTPTETVPEPTPTSTG